MDCWLLAFAFMYVAMDFLVFIVFHFMETLVLIVIYRDFLCYLVHRPQGCNKLQLTKNLFQKSSGACWSSIKSVYQ